MARQQQVRCRKCVSCELLESECVECNIEKDALVMGWMEHLRRLTDNLITNYSLPITDN